jgi:hypothetical protein
MAANAKVNYTESQVESIKAQYEALGNAGLEAIAESVQKSKRSVIAKLVREGVYQAEAKPVKVERDEGPTKKELLAELDSLGALDTKGLDAATKDAISAVITFVKANQAA